MMLPTLAQRMTAAAVDLHLAEQLGRPLGCRRHHLGAPHHGRETIGAMDRSIGSGRDRKAGRLPHLKYNRDRSALEMTTPRIAIPAPCSRSQPDLSWPMCCRQNAPVEAAQQEQEYVSATVIVGERDPSVVIGGREVEVGRPASAATARTRC
jgi:hypothetical protein